MSSALSLRDYVEGVRAGDRRMLAKAITLIESTRADHADLAERVLDALAPSSGQAVRLGVTGPPGVGKSCFIESLGLHLIGKGERVAVLAVDPSSSVRGGSILGDKTRMARLAQSEAAFVRPSPSGGTLGGVALRTRECLLACEAAGYSVGIVETVGVGQSETEVSQMVDFFAALVQPAAGDALQGIKKGVVELADALLVNKADGDLRALAESTRAEYQSALSLLRESPQALCVSALTGEGLERFWEVVQEHRAALVAAGELDQRRRAQLRFWLWRALREELEQLLRSAPETAAQLAELEEKLASGSTTPLRAARRLIESFLGRSRAN